MTQESRPIRVIVPGPHAKPAEAGETVHILQPGGQKVEVRRTHDGVSHMRTIPPQSQEANPQE